MTHFPPAVPEIPVKDLQRATDYYRDRLGFKNDWREESGIAGFSRGDCRLFLTDTSRRASDPTVGTAVIWLNLEGVAEVDRLHEEWRDAGATILSPPETKPWNLHEFTAADADGNRLRVFYDLAGDGERAFL